VEPEIFRKRLRAQLKEKGDLLVIPLPHHPDAAKAPGVVEEDLTVLQLEGHPGVGAPFQAKAPRHPQVDHHLPPFREGEEEELPPAPDSLYPLAFRPFRVAVAPGIPVFQLEKPLAHKEGKKLPPRGFHLR